MYRIEQGDCIELMKSIPDKSIDMILSIVSSSIKDGLSQRKADKEKSKEEGEKVSADADADFDSEAPATAAE